jgi:hypothetical protein
MRLEMTRNFNSNSTNLNRTVEKQQLPASPLIGAVNIKDVTIVTIASKTNGIAPGNKGKIENMGGHRIMSPYHPDWEEFCKMLLYEIQDDGEDHCSRNLDIAREVLESFPSVDVDASLAYFRERGGWCECTVLSHIKRDLNKDVNHLDFLDYLTQVANEEAFKYTQERNTCILTSAAMVYVLQYLGYQASPMRLCVQLHWNWNDPKHISGTVLGSDDRGTRVPPGLWGGHLGVVVMNRYLVDPTLDQVNHDSGGEWLPPLVAEVSPAFLAGSEQHYFSYGESALNYTAFPGRGGFKSAEAFRKSSWMPLAENILKRMLVTFAGSWFGPGTAQKTWNNPEAESERKSA